MRFIRRVSNRPDTISFYCSTIPTSAALELHFGGDLKYAFIMVLTLVCATVTFAAPKTSQAEGFVTYAADLFDRTVTSSWGTASTGGSYHIASSASDFDVRDSVGTINLPGKAR